MSLELINTAATLATFVVIAVAAIAAIVQLRHARSSNQIAVLNQLRQVSQSPELIAASHFVGTELSSKLRDAAFRYQLAHHSARTLENEPLIGRVMCLGNFYESMGLLLRTGILEPELAMELWSDVAISHWDELAPVAAMCRREAGDTMWGNFEYLVVLSQDWAAAHPKGVYPAGVRRIILEDEWLEADQQYLASLATAL